MSSALVLSLLLSAPGAVEPGPPPPQVVVTTSAGAFVIRLLPERAPKHVAHFLNVVKAGGFDGTTFHRIIPRGIIQGGDPLSKDPKQASQYGTGGLGLLKAEFSDQPMARGAVAAVRRPNDPNSAGQQFFVVLTDQPGLTGQFTIFGEVMEGMEVADRLGETPVDGDRATSRVEMKVALAPGTGRPSPVIALPDR